jgi:hypothetical protein
MVLNARAMSELVSISFTFLGIGELHLYFTEVTVYLAQQQALPPAERYLQSSIIRDGRTVIFGINPDLIKNIHRVRTLDCDTTFKPVAGSMQIFEVNAWLSAINEGAYQPARNHLILITYSRDIGPRMDGGS